MKQRLLFLVPALAVLLAGCASSPEKPLVNDLRVTGLSVITFDNAPSSLSTRMPQPMRSVLLVSFSSNRNLAETDPNLMQDEISVCPVDPARGFMTDRHIYYQGMDGKQYLYQLWFDYWAMSRANLRYNKPNYPAYDLQKAPADVCIAIGGDPANTVIIPKDAIAAALKNAPPGR